MRRPYFLFAVFLLTALTASVFLSCKTLRQPKSIPQPINYSDEDIVKNEIHRIEEFLQTEPLKALWRAALLGNQEVLLSCRSAVEEKLSLSYEEKNYLDTKKYYKSLISIFPDYNFEKASYTDVEKFVLKNGLGDSSVNNRAPLKISDCMNATVTIWVDRGVKVMYGTGYADVIIGSGFFIDERGYIITNNHVIDSMVNPEYEGYSRLYIKLLNDSSTKIPAKVIGYDSVLDLALIKAEVTPEFVLNLGESSELDVGDKISAIGSPIGLEGTITSGIVSSKDRALLALGPVFQIDAAVNSGNSGGPLIDSNMNVQAIVFAGMLQNQGLNFAIPVEYLKQELPLLYGRGEIIHSWVGCFGNTKRNGNQKIGLEVQYVLSGGPAFMAGLREGDVITKLDGKTISSVEEFNYIVMGYENETILECQYLDSKGSEKSCLLYLEKRPEYPGITVFDTDLIETSFIPLLGMKILPSSTTNKNSYTIENVLAGSTADDMHFSANDEITVTGVTVDQKNGCIYIQMTTRRKKKAFLDMGIGLAAPLDSSQYF